MAVCTPVSTPSPPKRCGRIFDARRASVHPSQKSPHRPLNVNIRQFVIFIYFHVEFQYIIIYLQAVAQMNGMGTSGGVPPGTPQQAAAHDDFQKDLLTWVDSESEVTHENTDISCSFFGSTNQLTCLEIIPKGVCGYIWNSLVDLSQLCARCLWSRLWSCLRNLPLQLHPRTSRWIASSTKRSPLGVGST